MSKTLVIGTVVAVVGITAVGGFLVWQQAGLGPSSSPAAPPAPAPQPNTQVLDTSDFSLSEVEGWQTYRNDEFGFEIGYLSSVQLYTSDSESQIPSLSYMDVCDAWSSPIFCLHYPPQLIKVSNDYSGGVAGAVTMQTVKGVDKGDCIQYNDFGNEFKDSYDIQTITTRNENGTMFYYMPYRDAGLGHIKDIHIYRAFHNNVCFAIRINIEYTHVNLPSFSEEDKKTLFTQLEQALSTFRFQE